MNEQVVLKKLEKMTEELLTLKNTLYSTVEEFTEACTTEKASDPDVVVKPVKDELFVTLHCNDFLTGLTVDLDKAEDIWVYWSGGIDSTAILLTLCKAYPKKLLTLSQ